MCNIYYTREIISKMTTCDEIDLALAECEPVIQLVTECEPLKIVPLEYNVSCWHCNPDRVITPHPNPPPLKMPTTLDFIDYRPTVSKPYDKKPVKRASKGSVLKSFDRPKNYESKNTKVITPNDALYSRQRIFMQVFQVDILNQQQFVDYHRIMRNFMNELDYTPTDKQDVMLFYYQESSQDLYDVYIARRSPLIKKYARVFEVDLENFDEALEFMQQIRTYIVEKALETDGESPIKTVTVNDLMAFLKKNNPEHVCVDVKIVKMLKQLKLNIANEVSE